MRAVRRTAVFGSVSRHFAYPARIKPIQHWASLRNRRLGGNVDPERTALLAVSHDAEEAIDGWACVEAHGAGNAEFGRAEETLGAELDAHPEPAHTWCECTRVRSFAGGTVSTSAREAIRGCRPVARCGRWAARSEVGACRAVLSGLPGTRT